MLVVVLSGLLAGLVHVLSGPDHLAAVAPLAAAGRGGWRTGARWGLGHVAGVLLVGLLALALRGILPVERVSGWSERLVGLVLIGIGAWGLFRAWRGRVHAHGHTHDGHGHVHVHLHEGHAPPAVAHAHIHAAFAVGVVHGLAGSSHILGVLPALALPFAQGATYLVAFGIGTVAAMAGFSEALGHLAGRAAARGTDLYRGLMATTGAAAILVGIYWLFS
ncbi:MAG: High-affinity nickel transporter [Candidatus Coatesbacteria bacterium]